MSYDVCCYPPSTYIILDQDYGYNYFRLDFLEGAEELADKDVENIVDLMRDVFVGYVEKLEA